jgi:hypothetical protein
MPTVPESLADEIARWIAHERDAAYAAKLAILRLERCEDIAHFGRVLGEHERHADELGGLLRATRPDARPSREPSFATREAHVIGALRDGERILAEMAKIESTRIARYRDRPRRKDDEPHRMLDAVLERHLGDARARVAWLEKRRAASRPSVRRARVA